MAGNEFPMFEKGGTPSKRKPAFARKKPPVPPSDGDESAAEMTEPDGDETGAVTCPECGCTFAPGDEEPDNS